MRIAAHLGPLLVLTACLATSAQAQSVHVVDDGGGADFTRIVDAVAAAADGDIVLVKDGIYSSEGTIALGSGSLWIVAEVGANVDVTAKFVVTNLAAGKEIGLRGLDVQNGAFSLCYEATNCAGVLWIEGCLLKGFAASFFDAPDPVVVTDCSSVVVRDCTITGGTGINGLSGGSAIRSVRSSLFLESSVLTGGVGAQIPSTLAGDVGGAGITLEDGVLVAADGSITGGVGGEGGAFGVCTDSGDGGVGLLLTGTSPVATLRGVVLDGGEPGDVTGTGSCTQGQKGAPSQIDAGSLNEYLWAAHTFSVGSPVRTDETAVATFSGTPGDSVWIGLSGDSAPLFVPALNGVLYSATPITVRFVGVIDGTGSATYTTPTTLGSMVEGDVITTQALFFSPGSATFTLGAPSAVAILDPAF